MAYDISQAVDRTINTTQNTLNSMANRAALAVTTGIAQAEEQRAVASEELDRLALQRTQEIAAGEGININDPDVSAEDLGRFQILAGQQYLAAGAPKRGQEMLEAGLDYIKKQGEINAQADTQNKTRLENWIKASNAMAQIFADAQNENEYQTGLANLPKWLVDVVGEEPIEQLRRTPWSPEVTEYFRDKALSVKDQATLDLQQMRAETADQRARDAADIARAQQEIARLRHEESVRRNDILEKAGGNKSLAAPTSNERIAARNALAGNIPGLALGKTPNDDADDVMGAVNDVVIRAQNLVQNNKGLSFAEAANRAVIDMKAEGHFASTLEWRSLGPFSTGKKETGRTYNPRGMTPENPVILKKPDRSKLIEGRYYEINGQVLQYGTDFK